MFSLVKGMLFHLFTFLLGLFVANLVEWLVHKYVLHGLGMKKGSFWSFHWHKHHRTARQNSNVDLDYNIKPGDEGFWNASGKEIFGLGLLFLPSLLACSVAPMFTVACALSAVLYFYVHRKSHLDVEWGKKWLRHHYDHHQGTNQNLNWCVTHPLWDIILKTRVRYDYDESGKVKKTL